MCCIKKGAQCLFVSGTYFLVTIKAPCFCLCVGCTVSVCAGAWVTQYQLVHVSAMRISGMHMCVLVRVHGCIAVGRCVYALVVVVVAEYMPVWCAPALCTQELGGLSYLLQAHPLARRRELGNVQGITLCIALKYAHTHVPTRMHSAIRCSSWATHWASPCVSHPCACIHTRARARTHTHTHMRMRVCCRSWATCWASPCVSHPCACIHTRARARTHTYTHAHACNMLQELGDMLGLLSRLAHEYPDIVPDLMIQSVDMTEAGGGSQRKWTWLDVAARGVDLFSGLLTKVHGQVRARWAPCFVNAHPPREADGLWRYVWLDGGGLHGALCLLCPLRSFLALACPLAATAVLAYYLLHPLPFSSAVVLSSTAFLLLCRSTVHCLPHPLCLISLWHFCPHQHSTL